MFILDSLLIGSLRFVLDKVVAAAEAEAQDDTALREQLLEAQMRLELGEITEDEFAEIERDVLARIREIKGGAQGALTMSPDEDKITGIETMADDSKNKSSRSSPPATSHQPQFIFFGGKGGVGKTTCAAARAVAAARAGARVLAVSTDPAHSLGDALGVRLTSRPSSVAASLRGVELDAPRAFARWLAEPIVRRLATSSSTGRGSIGRTSTRCSACRCRASTSSSR